MPGFPAGDQLLNWHDMYVVCTWTWHVCSMYVHLLPREGVSEHGELDAENSKPCPGCPAHFKCTNQVKWLNRLSGAESTKQASKWRREAPAEPLRLQRLLKRAPPHLRDAVQLPKKVLFFCFFFALNTKTTKISLYKLFFSPKQSPKARWSPPPNQSETKYCHVNHLSKQAFCAQLCDWEEGDSV